MLDPIRKCSGCDHLWPLRSACSQNRAGSHMLDWTSCIQFSSVLPKKAWIILCKTGPDPIWMAWPGFGQIHLCVRIIGPSWRQSWQNATGLLPVSHFQTWLCSSMDDLDYIMQNQPRSNLVLADCQVLAKQIRSRSKLVCKNHWACFWQLLWTNPDQMQIRSSIYYSQFTLT